MIKDRQTSKVYLPALALAVSKCSDQISVVDGFWWVKCEENRWVTNWYLFDTWNTWLSFAMDL